VLACATAPPLRAASEGAPRNATANTATGAAMVSAVRSRRMVRDFKSSVLRFRGRRAANRHDASVLQSIGPRRDYDGARINLAAADFAESIRL